MGRKKLSTRFFEELKKFSLRNRTRIQPRDKKLANKKYGDPIEQSSVLVALHTFESSKA